MSGRIVALCGGVGGAKLAYGLSRVLGPEQLTIIVNTGDDFEHLGLEICPDLDTVLYTLGEVENVSQGWGRAGEGWNVLDEVKRLGGPAWFLLGDKDIALHLTRLQMRREGASLTEVVRALAKALGVPHPILPMADQPVRTIVETAEGELAFQEYFVGQLCAPVVKGFRFDGAERAKLSQEVAAALSGDDLAGVILCPSNPYVSIAPMLAVPGFRTALEAVKAPILAVSPIVGGAAIKGPAAKMMAELGVEVSALAVARHYKGLINAMVVDLQDEDALEQWAPGDPLLFAAPTVMTDRETRIDLAKVCLDLLTTLKES